MSAISVPGQYVGTIESAAANNGVPASLLASVLNSESGFNPTAISSAGAEGIAQFMPGTATGLGVNPWDPTSAINGAAQYLAQLYKQLGSWTNAVAGYNAGAGAVQKYGGVPPYTETQNYVTNVFGNEPAYRQLDTNSTGGFWNFGWGGETAPGSMNPSTGQIGGTGATTNPLWMQIFFPWAKSQDTPFLLIGIGILLLGLALVIANHSDTVIETAKAAVAA